jgi:hypothetical protein
LELELERELELELGLELALVEGRTMELSGALSGVGMDLHRLSVMGKRPEVRATSCSSGSPTKTRLMRGDADKQQL